MPSAIYISIDAEGIAGISDWEQIRTTGDDFELGRRLMLGELNAAIDGVLDVLPDARIVVNDSHATMRNFPPDELHGNAELIAGRHKPLYMMQGLDASFDAILCVGYHGSIGARNAILSHTYNPRAIWEVRINGYIASELAINGLVAAHYGIPVVFVSGDATTVAESHILIPEIEAVMVKDSVSRFAAQSLHPHVARERIRQGVANALRHHSYRECLPHYETPTQIEVTFLTSDMAESCMVLRGVELHAEQPRTVICKTDDRLELFRTFVGMIQITRPLVE
jgi:D-amino peptidase